MRFIQKSEAKGVTKIGCGANEEVKMVRIRCETRGVRDSQ